MAEDKRKGQDGAAPPQGPAEGHLNAGPDPRTVRYVLVTCPYCQADISRTCLGATLTTPVGLVQIVYHPLRCPECNHPLLETLSEQRLIVPM